MSDRRPHPAIAFLYLATIAWGLSFPLTKAPVANILITLRPKAAP